MNEDHDKSAILSLLCALGLEAEPIPEASYPTPDLRIQSSDGNVLIEVKSREDDRRLRAMVASPEGTPYGRPSSTLYNRLRDAWHQIRDFPDRSDQDFTLVWYIARWPHGMTVLDHLLIPGLLYGTEHVEGETTAGTSYEQDCLFLRNSLFSRYRDLDGVVVQDGETLQLCLNSLSRRYAAFRASPLASIIAGHFTVTDPIAMEAAGECFVAEPTGRSFNDSVGALKTKHGLATARILRFIPYNQRVEGP